MAKTSATKNWPVKAMDPPKLSANEWYFTMVLGLVFIAMAVLQLIGFSDFETVLTNIGLSSPATWAVILILGELWAASGFFKLALSKAFRMVSSMFAVLVSGFWFFEAIRQAAVGPDMVSPVSNMGYFGRFLSQTPGWWTIVEASVVLFLTLFAVSLTRVDN